MFIKLNSPEGDHHAVFEQVEEPNLSRLYEEPREKMLEERGELWSMTAMAGELRWIISKDMAQQRRILALERELEDKYYTLQEQVRTKELERQRKQDEEDQARLEMMNMLIQQEDLSDELVLNEAMDRLERSSS